MTPRFVTRLPTLTGRSFFVDLCWQFVRITKKVKRLFVNSSTHGLCIYTPLGEGKKEEDFKLIECVKLRRAAKPRHEDPILANFRQAGQRQRRNPAAEVFSVLINRLWR